MHCVRWALSITSGNGFRSVTRAYAYCAQYNQSITTTTIHTTWGVMPFDNGLKWDGDFRNNYALESKFNAFFNEKRHIFVSP